MSKSLKSSSVNSSSNHNSYNYIGVDGAKDKFDIFIYDTNQFITITNNKSAINKLVKPYLIKLDNPLISL